MNAHIADTIVDAYLKQLRLESQRLPSGSRDELMQQITEHLREAAPAGSSEAAARTALDQLGTPAEIVAEQRARLGLTETTRGTREWITLILLPLGGLVIPVLGWLVGVGLLWTSKAWTTRDKLIGTLVVPGGLAIVPVVALLAASATSCTGGPRDATAHCVSASSELPTAIAAPLVLIAVVASLLTPVFLARRARHAYA